MFLFSLFYIQCMRGDAEIKKHVFLFLGHCRHVILRGKHFLAAHFLFPSNNSNVERVEKRQLRKGGWPLRLKGMI